jgi:outer membrane lipoprotein SlyB
MFKKGIIGLLSLAILISTVFAAGCETKAQSGALIGAGGGALLGQAIGGNTTGTLIGAAAGAAGGALIGHSMDKSDEKKAKQAAPAASDQNTVTVWLTNSNGSQTPVRLTRNADGTYVGPKGEQYPTMPTEEQLKPVYGIQ